MFVAAVDVIDAINDGLSIGDQRGENERSRGAEIAGQNGGGAKGSFASDYRPAAFNLNVRAHADEFLGVHEAVLENVFRNDRRAFGLRGERHELCLDRKSTRLN